MTGKFIENFEAMFTSLKILGYMPLFTFDNINIRLLKERNDQQHICFCSGIKLILRNMKSLVLVLKYCIVTILL